MTEPDLNAAEQEAVRRRLADARHDEPMPADVVERLDEVLAELSAERAGGGEVISIGSARAPDSDAGPTRPGRRWPAYLLSAAAVVAIGFGVSQVIPDSANDSAGSSAASDSQPSMAASENDESLDSTAPESEAKNEAPATASDRYTAQSFPLPDIQGLSPRNVRDKELGTARKLSQLDAARLAERCVPHDIPKTSVVRAASFRGEDAVVVYLPPADSERRIEVYVCGSSSDEPIRTVTLSPKE